MEYPLLSHDMDFDNSPTDSYISTPDQSYSSLFAVATSPSSFPATMNPMEMMTPLSFPKEKMADYPSPVLKLETVDEADELDEADEDDDGDDAEDEDGEESLDSDKKPTKKRKSWGQILPEPKTNLPPRKRAKTDDEKEQRRVERVLRNRRAAQSSRERKRLEVEALEKRNKHLEDLLINAQKTNVLLVEELNRFRRSSGVVARSSSPLHTLHDNPVTLSQELFSSQTTSEKGPSASTLMSDMMNPTVNPASLSPEPTPVADSDDHLVEEATAEAKPSEQTLSTSPALTQLPAVMLCDLPCQTSAEVSKLSLASQTSMSPLLVFSLQLRMLLLSASVILSACQRPLTQIALSSKANFSLLPSPRLLTTIIWLVTIPPASRTSPTLTSSTLTTSSTTRQTTATSPRNLWQRATAPLRSTASTSRSTTLRLKSLKKILSSSPNLARPLSDATMVALRLVSSEGRDDRVETLRRESVTTRDADCELTQCLSGIALPSKEVLLTLLWALKVEERRIQRRSDAVLDPESGALEQPTKKSMMVMEGAASKRRSEGGVADGIRLEKRC